MPPYDLATTQLANMNPASRPALFTLVLSLALCAGAAAQTSPLRDRASSPTTGPTAGPTEGTRVAMSTGDQAALGTAALPTIMLTGYWPPSNEALRPFSTDPLKNPAGWVGANWEGRGYDVHAFFPEFGIPTCGQCGKGQGELEVDYQDTTGDFWPLADGLAPMAVMTFSRGFIDMSWEVENNLYNRSTWVNDYVAPLQPTPAPPDANYPADMVRNSTLPKQQIVNAVAAAGLGLVPAICFSQDAGGFLSEFIGYLGVWYQDLHSSPADPAWCIGAGHIHVGGLIPWPTAQAAVEVSLREVITGLDAVRSQTVCQSDLGFGGPGSSELRVCGGDLSTGSLADLSLTGGPPGAFAWLAVGATMSATPLFGGIAVPVPPSFVLPLVLDGNGDVYLKGIAGGGGPATLYAQAVLLDPAAPGGFGISNALAVQLMP